MPRIDDQAAALVTEKEDVARRTIQDLVDTHPEVLYVLAPLGIDLCCGGSHQLGTSLDLHQIDPDPILTRVVDVVFHEASRN